MVNLTVYTTAYNRAHTLPRLYQSLISQTNQKFKWLIIDDGSTDNTKDLIETWIEQKKLDITYIYQVNQGLVKAHETGIFNIETEYNVSIDSDDYMPKDAVEIIYNTINNNPMENFVGLIGLDRYHNSDKIIGNKFPKNLKSSNFSDLTEKFGISGDKKVVNKTALCKKYLPLPKFGNERYPALGYLFIKLNEINPYLLINEVLCIVEYQDNGISKNKMKQYSECPQSFCHYRIEKMKVAPSFKSKFRHAIHYISSCIFAKKWNIFEDNPFVFTSLLAIPFGIALNIYIRKSNRTTFNKKLDKSKQ